MLVEVCKGSKRIPQYLKQNTVCKVIKDVSVSPEKKQR